MLHGIAIYTVLVYLSQSSLMSAFTNTKVYEALKKSDHLDNNATDEATKTGLETEKFVAKSERLQNMTDHMLGKISYEHLSTVEIADSYNITATESPSKTAEYNDSFSKDEVLEAFGTDLHNDPYKGSTTSPYHNEMFTSDTLASTNAKTDRQHTLISKTVLEKSTYNIPYHIHNSAERARTLTLEKKKTQLQHHLQLVPMEDKPLDALMYKNQRYLVSVLVPIGVGMIGAAMIVCTVFTLRKIARKRAFSTPFDDDADLSRPNTPCVSSISAETTDKMFLLLGDDGI